MSLSNNYIDFVWNIPKSTLLLAPVESERVENILILENILRLKNIGSGALGDYIWSSVTSSSYLSSRKTGMVLTMHVVPLTSDTQLEFYFVVQSGGVSMVRRFDSATDR